nr:hypothetical protein [Schinkia azotoformans]
MMSRSLVKSSIVMDYGKQELKNLLQLFEMQIIKCPLMKWIVIRN